MSFYKNENGSLLCGPNFVENQNYSLQRSNHEEYTYPVDGWYWFETDEEARAFFGLPEPKPYVPEMPPLPPGYSPYMPYPYAQGAYLHNGEMEQQPPQ